MRKTELKKILSLILCIVLIAVTALFAAGCSDKTDSQDADVEEAPISESSDVTLLGEGATAFDLTVVDGEGNESAFTINTDETTVGNALLALEFIAGDESEYGLYVKTVNGTTLDYNKDGKYWAFYVNDAYATKGVEKTEIDDSAKYCFKAE